MYVCMFQSPAAVLFGCMKSKQRTWYLKSRAWVGTDSKWLHFSRDFVSVVSLWHKQAVRISVDSLPSLDI